MFAGATEIDNLVKETVKLHLAAALVRLGQEKGVKPAQTRGGARAPNPEGREYKWEGAKPVCWKCGKTGHMGRDCTEKKEENANATAYAAAAAGASGNPAGSQ